MENMLYNLVAADEYLISNITNDVDAFGLTADWAHEYDVRVKQIELHIIKSIFTSERSYTGEEVASLMTAYHEFISNLNDHKNYWIKNKEYDMQGISGFAFNDLIKRCMH